MERPASPQALLEVWLKTSLRYWLRHKLQSAILIAIIALGVASFLSIRMANRAAVKGFSGFTETVTGEVDFTLEAQGGRFPVSWLSGIRKSLQQNPVELAPVLEVLALVETSVSKQKRSSDFLQVPGESLRILGVDIIGIQNFNNQNISASLLFSEEGEEERDIFSIARDPKALFISPRLAENLWLSAGDEVEVIVDDQRFILTVRGILPTSRSGVEVPENLAIMDLPAAMALAGKPDVVSRVEVIVEAEERSEAFLETIRISLSEHAAGRWRVLQTEQQEEKGAAMTSAFRLNLTILSLISLLVGLYLICQSIDAAVIQRRKEIGILRALGLIPKEIKKLWLLDLTALGFLGGFFGIFIGWASSQIVIVAIARTVSALYTETTAESAQLNSIDCLIGMGLGVFGSLLAGTMPLSVATRTSPAKIIASGRQELNGVRYRYQWLGGILLLLGCLSSLAKPVIFSNGQAFPVFGYITALCWLLGGALTVAGLISPLGKVLHRGVSKHLAAGLGIGKLRLPGNRHRLAVSGLFVAIGMAASMSILIGSFETTITHWLKTRFQADIYVASRAFSGASSQYFIRSTTIAQLAEEPGIDAVSTQRYLPIQFQEKQVYLVGIRTELIEDYEKFLWIDPLLSLSDMPDGAEFWAIINETYCYRFGYRTGDVVTLESSKGSHPIWIRGMKADYGNDQGAILVDQKYLESWYEVYDFSNATLYLSAGVDVDLIVEDLKERFPELAIREQGALLKNALQVFKETFVVTYALKVLGLFVAVLGLALALLNILREDVSSLHTLRTLGVTRAERAGITAFEGTGMTLIATLGGILLSFALGWLLVFVINRQSFGWTLQYAVPWVEILSLGILLVALGALVSWLVGWLAGNEKPVQEE